MMLFIDGNFLTKRNISKANNSSEAIFSIISSIKRMVGSLYPQKCVVFWDAEDGGAMRHEIYPPYKANRQGKSWHDYSNYSQSEITKILEDRESSENIRLRVKLYLQHLFIRQVSFAKHEADDLLHYACSLYGNEERIVVFTNDRDLAQCAYAGSKVEIIFAGDGLRDDNGAYMPYTMKTLHNALGMHPKNIVLYKTFNGDSADNIKSAHGVGKTLLAKIFDWDKELGTLEDCMEMISQYYRTNPSKSAMSLRYMLSSSDWVSLKPYEKEIKKVKYMVEGNKSLEEAVNMAKGGEDPMEQYRTLMSVIELGGMISEDAKDAVSMSIDSPMSLEDRGGKYLLPLMIGDSFLEHFGLLPRNGQISNPLARDRFRSYVEPFLLLVEQEKRYTNKCLI